MDEKNLNAIQEAYELYQKMQNTIKEVHGVSNHMGLMKEEFDMELDDILYDTDEYLGQILKNIAFAHGEFSEEEQTFISKLNFVAEREEEVNPDDSLDSINEIIPIYIKMAVNLDNELRSTRFTEDLIEITKRIYWLLQDLDGIYFEERKYANDILEKLNEYVRNNKKGN